MDPNFALAACAVITLVGAILNSLMSMSIRAEVAKIDTKIAELRAWWEKTRKEDADTLRQWIEKQFLPGGEIKSRLEALERRMDHLENVQRAR